MDCQVLIVYCLCCPNDDSGSILVLGFVCYFLAYYGYDTVEFINSFVIMFTMGIVFAVCYLQCVSALYITRQSQVSVQKLKKTSLSAEEIKRELGTLIAEKNGFDHIESVNEFISHLETRCARGANLVKKLVLTENSKAIAKGIFDRTQQRCIKDFSP